MEVTSSNIDSLVMFSNSQGQSGRGTLVHITRSVAIFEIYNPYSIIQLSEALPEIRILRGDRIVYEGKAVVSNMVSTGLMIIVSATLIDTWSDLSGLAPGGELLKETKRFLYDWDRSYQLDPDYQLSVSNIRSFLGELNRWLDEAKIGLESNPGSIADESFYEEFYHEVQEPVIPRLNELFSRFESYAEKIPEEQVTEHKTFARRELHPLTLCAPIVHRSYTKPLGFAGDYEMINMTLGASTNYPRDIYARMVHDYFIETETPLSNRERTIELQGRLHDEATRVIGEEERIFTVLNVGCGPAMELQKFINEDPLSGQSSIFIMDFNDETLDFVTNRLDKSVRDSKNNATLKYVNKSIDELLKDVNAKKPIFNTTFDMVYCAGLFDYFSDSICKRLVKTYFSLLKPGGLLTITNVHPRHPVRYHMEHLLEWHLVYRDEKKVGRLAQDLEHRVSAEKYGINIFLDIRNG